VVARPPRFFFAQIPPLKTIAAKICRLALVSRKKLPCPWGITPTSPQDVVLKKVGPQIASRRVNHAKAGENPVRANDFSENDP